jgi:hypothetical protein
MSIFMRSDQSIFKLVSGGSDRIGLALNLMSLSLTLITPICLAGLRFGSVVNQIGRAALSVWTAAISAHSNFGRRTI